MFESDKLAHQLQLKLLPPATTPFTMGELLPCLERTGFAHRQMHIDSTSDCHHSVVEWGLAWAFRTCKWMSPFAQQRVVG